MTRKRIASAAGAIAGIGAACFGWGLLEARMFTVHHVQLPLLGASDRRELRLLHLSDIHLMPGQARKLQFLRELARLKPDVVVNTGDNLSHPEAVEPLLEALSGLHHVPGVFVFGSNDYVAPVFKNPLRYVARGHADPSLEGPALPTAELKAAFEDVGWSDLTNQRATVTASGFELAFRGADDAHVDLDRYDLVAGRAQQADLNIGVTHAPYRRLLDAMTADAMDLILAGHTHGGQVCVPGYGALVTNCDIEPGRVKGLSAHTKNGHTSHLHVSAGVGTSPFAPYRFACRPEVTLLTLTARA